MEVEMPIYDHKYGGLDYFRVYRSWAGKEYQEYVRIGDNREAARREAEKIEKRLDSEYEIYQREQASLPGFHVRSDGSIRGLRRVTVARDSRAPVDVLELRINVPWQKGVKRTTISIATHGFEEAFSQAINKIREWYGLEESNPAVKAMRACDAFYAQGDEIGAIKSVTHKAKHELDNLAQGVFKGLRKLGISGVA
ncbi:hypothetical protein A3765_13475 [Oleiphilus sp. HI0130]|nr:hypothetical protein A3765_13475 [Oleiphilus sp. HI0130]